MRIDIVIPTHNRKSKLSRCINSILNSNWQDYQIHVVNDHHERFAFGIWNEFLYDNYPDYSEEAGRQSMFYLCDDTELDLNCLTELAYTMMTRFADTDGVVGVNQVNIPNGSPSAMGLIGRKFAQRYKFRQCFCPSYHSFYADSELREYAESVGKFHYCESAHIKHYHPSFYPKEKDQTHDKVREAKASDQTVRAERQRLKLLWPIA